MNPAAILQHLWILFVLNAYLLAALAEGVTGLGLMFVWDIPVPF